jgi:hypothetical protein
MGKRCAYNIHIPKFNALIRGTRGNNLLSILENAPLRCSHNARNTSVRQTLLIALHCFGTLQRYTENMHITIQMPYAERSQQAAAAATLKTL